MNVERNETLHTIESDSSQTIGKFNGVTDFELKRFLGRLATCEFGHVLGIKGIDRAWNTFIETQITGIHIQSEARVNQVWIHREESTAVACTHGGIEESNQTNLFCQAIGKFDHTERGEVLVLRKEVHRVCKDDIAFRVTNRHRGRISVTEEIHIRAGNTQWLIDLDGLLLRLFALDLRGDLSGEVDRLTYRVGVLLFIDNSELIQLDCVGRKRG